MSSTSILRIGEEQLATPPIRGRAEELAEMNAQVTSVAHGGGGVLVIEGQPGVGKSRLLTELSAQAEKAGVRTLFGEAFENQRTVPFFSLFMATLSAHPPVGDVDALRRLGASADLSYWVVHDLHNAIQSAATQTPLLIVLEDIHFADNHTLLALRSLATARQDAAVLWVLTARTGAGGSAVQETLAVLRRANATFMRVAPISASAVADMVADEVHAKVDESLLEVAGKAEGNPFLVREILGGLSDEGRLHVRAGRAAASGAGLPQRLSTCMRRRLDLLSRDTSDVVRVAAVLPDLFSAKLLAAMLERQPAALMSALAEAVQAGLLIDEDDELRFGHKLIREATRRSLPQSLRRAMERQSASIMLEMGAAPTEVAVQLAGSADPGDKEAIHALRTAAKTVSDTDASAAADLSKRALELIPAGDTEHGRVVAETVGLLNRARRYGESEELAVGALLKASAEEEAEIRLQYPAFTKYGSRRRAEENRRALELSHIDEVTRARHQALLAYNLMLDDADGLHRAAAEDAAGTAELVGDVESKVIANLALASFDAVGGNACRAVDSLEQLCSLRRTTDLPLAHRLAAIYYATSLAYIGRLDDAAKQVACGLEEARQEANSMGLDIWATIEGMVHLAAGRLHEARTAVESLPPPEQAGMTELDAMRLAVLTQVAISTDDRTLLQQNLSYAHKAYADGPSMVQRTAAYVLALAAWHRNDLADASHRLDDIDLLGTPPIPQSLDHLVLAARISSAAGDAGCRARVMRAAQRLEHDKASIPLFGAVAAYIRGLLESDADALVTAADMLASSSRPLFYAAAMEDSATQLIRAQRRDEALHRLNTAFDTYTHLGAFADARRVGRHLRRLGVERRIVIQARAKTGWDSLTDSELKVVNLIAQGATNRATADQLHLSLHTVKTHVHNAFAKLEISSRGQLAQAML